MIRFKYLLTPIAWVIYNNKVDHNGKVVYIPQRELLLFGIRIYIHTIS